jgi:hypothetical protein
MRVANALSRPSKGQILLHMENFPTPQLAMVPRITNLLTLVLLVGTTWWSSAQRPLAQDTPVLSAKPALLQVANKTSQLPVDNPAPPSRPAASPAISSDGIIAVGFNGASMR